MLPWGVGYFNYCEKIPPYVHIAVVDMWNGFVEFSIVHEPVVEKNKLPYLPLRKISHWSSKTRVTMSPFYWEGDNGTARGQFGLAAGYVRAKDVVLGSNRIGGGYYRGKDEPHYPSTGNKRVAYLHYQGQATFEDRDFVTLPCCKPHAISSSTSIVKKKECSTNTETYRWAALGSTENDEWNASKISRIVLIASTSDGQTTAKDLCPVFRALGVENAIRLDGGPTVAMTVDGRLLNPLTGLYRLKYGEMRHIPYALKIADMDAGPARSPRE